MTVERSNPAAGACTSNSIALCTQSISSTINKTDIKRAYLTIWWLAEMPLAPLTALKTAAWSVLFFQLLRCILFLVYIHSNGFSMKGICSVRHCRLLETIYQRWCWWLDPLKKNNIFNVDFDFSWAASISRWVHPKLLWRMINVHEKFSIN